MKQHKPSDQHKQNSDKQAEASPVLQKKSEPEQQKACTKDNSPTTDQSKSESFSWKFWLPNIIQTTVALFTFGTLIVIYFQLTAFREQTQILQQQLINDHRAWITIKTASHSEFKKGQPVTINLTFINSGNSPALNVTLNNMVAFRNTVVPFPMPLNHQSNPTEMSRSVIGPHSEFLKSSPSENIVTAKQIQDVEAGKVRLYVWGRIEYEDIFNQRRFTEFCIFSDREATNFNVCHNNNAAN